jgi:hypothetical protein
MVTTMGKFKDEVSGKLFDKIEDAEASEARSTEIRDAFSFYDPIEDVKCRFANGKWCVQRTEEFYNRLLDTLVEMVEKYEPWTAKSFRESGNTLSRDVVKGYSFLGRYLDGGHSDLYHWWGIQGNICPVCFREYGQMYYALHCTHDDKIPVRR